MPRHVVSVVRAAPRVTCNNLDGLEYSILLVHSQGVLQASGLDSGIGAGTAILGYLGPSREDPLRPFSSAPRHLASGALSLSLLSLRRRSLVTV